MTMLWKLYPALLVLLLIPLSSGQTPLAPVVDLDYAQYQGYYDVKYDLNVYKGIRYAAPPVGSLRWQLPQPPIPDRSQVFPAVDYASECPQSGNRPSSHPDVPSGSEDCLFINVLAPANKTMLPVLFWIHGGGYGQSNGSFEASPQIHTNGNTYIVVSIQYRLGAFGFLSSAELAGSGVPNAGIYDMYFALQWVQQYIHLFGGDPGQVTIAGQSAGAGGVMILSTIFGGANGTSLFKGLITSSPYAPPQWPYDGVRPTEYYYRFAENAGCLSDDIQANQSVFDCLVAADTDTLQIASNNVSRGSPYGQWAFIPVTDGTLIRGEPASQLMGGGNLNGIRILSGNNMNEGPQFMPMGIASQDDLRAFVLSNFPLLSEENQTTILALYSVPTDASTILTNSDGQSPPYSTTNSGWATGWEQAAMNLYAEVTFVCPSYWLANGYAKAQGGKAWHLQFSVPPGQHGLDLDPLLQPTDTPGTSMDEVFRTAFQRIWGNFIVQGDPTLSQWQTATAGPGNITAAGSGVWPQWQGQTGSDWMLNLNMTGGTPTTTPFVLDSTTVQVASYTPSNDAPPLVADFTLVEGSSWEAGRGRRCQLWADLGP